MPELRNLSICFDLDGTLVDTAPDLVRVLNLVIAEDGLEETNYTAARDRVGFGARALINEAFARAGKPVTVARADELLALFLKLYAEDIARLSRPFPGVIDTLHELRGAGARLSVCTNKPGYLARPLIEALNMTRFFERTIGSQDGFTSKPAPEHIFAATGHKNAKNIVMIGDALPDVLAARNAGIPVILMGYGYADTPPATLRADRVLRRFRDLPEAIKALPL
ncbi:MAG: HAD-IA family hydrolase [Alphaproteobacteria bacterium]